MKKIFLFFILTTSFFLVKNAQAADPFQNQEIKKRYSGSIVAYDDGFSKSYWYLVPEKDQRYLLKNSADLSKILTLFGQGIKNQDLVKINTIDSQNSGNYNLAQQLKGQFLLQVESHGEAWYVHPLDNRRYYIANGAQGLETIKNLAIDIDRSKLELFALASDSSPLEKKDFEFFRYFEVFDLLKNRYYQPEVVIEKELFYGSLKGLTESLGDPYTEFFTPSDKQEFADQLEGTLEGIGVIVDTRAGILEIISPLENSPAQKAGLRAKDQILIVGDIDIYGWKLEESTALIKGPAGTQVILGVYRPLSKENFSLKITREKINIESISPDKLNGNIAYLKINRFDLNLKNDFEKIKESTLTESRAIILDLRNNAGGYSQAALDLADYWLPKDVIIMQEKYPDSLYFYNSRQNKEINLPTVILVNQGTASAAEIFSAALSEHGIAKIIGDKTFGKGTGQMLFNFPDNSALKFSIFEWLTPNGQSLEKNGLEPDIKISNQADDFDYQLQKAIEILSYQ